MRLLLLLSALALPLSAAAEHLPRQEPQQDRSGQGIVDRLPAAATANVAGVHGSSALHQHQATACASEHVELAEQPVHDPGRQPLVFAAGGHAQLSHERQPQPARQRLLLCQPDNVGIEQRSLLELPRYEFPAKEVSLSRASVERVGFAPQVFFAWAVERQA